MKKIASLVGAGVLVLGMSIPAFAGYRHYRSSDDTSIRNYARVTNDVEVEAETGDNEISGMMVFGGRIRTGLADAWGDVSNRVNYNNIGCNCDGDLTIRNSARVSNDVEVEAETGDNEVRGMFVRGGRIGSGDAWGSSLVENVINTNVVGN